MPGHNILLYRDTSVHFSQWLVFVTRTHTHTHTHARARTRTHARIYAHSHTHARSHTHTHSHSDSHTPDSNGGDDGLAAVVVNAVVNPPVYRPVAIQGDGQQGEDGGESHAEVTEYPQTAHHLQQAQIELYWRFMLCYSGTDWILNKRHYLNH